MARHCFKVIYNKRKIGIIANSYDECINKIKKKFGVSLKHSSLLMITLEDGTEVDDEYFETLEDNTELYISTSSTFYQPLLQRLDSFLNDYTAKHLNDIDKKLSDALKEGDYSSVFNFLGSLAVESEECTNNDKKMHPSWFEGLNTKFIKKTDVLRNSAEIRIRSYLYKLKKDLESHNENRIYLSFLNELQTRLKANKYNAAYFDRTSSEAQRLCSDTGRFHCYGPYNCRCCITNHIINPYGSKESRILFSTWNLDHVIEKSRAVIPTLKKALDSPHAADINVTYFFNLLFEHAVINSDGNLKLVHIACHDKTPHDAKCDRTKVFSPSVSVTDSPQLIELPHEQHYASCDELNREHSERKEKIASQAKRMKFS